MAKRPVFIPTPSAYPFVKTIDVEFKWYPGMAKSQAQKSIRSLHEAAVKSGIPRILEISSKAEDGLGVSLSAFNLYIANSNKRMSVECAFQGSKVFEKGGPYTDLYNVSSLDAKRDDRIRSSGAIIGFDFMNIKFPIVPTTFFYDWLYITALHQNMKLSEQIMRYDGFTDIAFNPKKSWNCQARSAALYLALHASGDLDQAVTDIIYYTNLVIEPLQITNDGVQMGFGFD